MALIDIDNLEAEEIARKAMRIAGDMCVYTNHNLVVETIDPDAPKKSAEEGELAAREEEQAKSETSP